MEKFGKSHYEVIGVRTTATHDEIRDACFRLGELYRPDKNPGDAYCAARFADIEEAYLVLCNPEAREAYDRRLAHAAEHSIHGPKWNQIRQSDLTIGAAGLA